MSLRSHRFRPFPGTWRVLGTALLLAAAAGTAWGQAAPGAGPPREAAGAQLAFIERLYRDGDAYRAESEVLRFLYDYPRHPRAPDVELARAKLYYRDGRYPDARFMLISLLDRRPRGAVADDARRLLTFAQLRLDAPRRAAETAASLGAPGRPAPTAAQLDALFTPPPDAVEPEAAVAWSTWLPGSGYFLLGEPGKAATGLTLNLALLGATVYAAQKDNVPAALLFLFFEGLLWQGGRSGVRQDAEALNRRLHDRRLDGWMAAHGEPDLLRVGITLRFGGAPGADAGREPR